MVRIHTTAIGPSGEIIEFIDPLTGEVKTSGSGGGTIEGPIEVTGIAGQPVSVAGELSVSSNGIGSGSVYGTLTVGTSATELKVGASALVDRIFILVVNTSANDIYVGFDNLVTTANGIPIRAGDERSFDLSTISPISLFAIATINSEVRIAEVK